MVPDGQSVPSQVVHGTEPMETVRQLQAEPRTHTPKEKTISMMKRDEQDVDDTPRQTEFEILRANCGKRGLRSLQKRKQTGVWVWY